MVRRAEHLEEVSALVLPGGESTTISMLLERQQLFEPLAARLAAGMPALGTCAGMILLAADVADGRSDQRSFGAIDIGVRRNGYGRQVDSFEADLTLAARSFAAPSGADRSGSAGTAAPSAAPSGADRSGSAGTAAPSAAPSGAAPEPFHAVFIRAPLVERVGEGVDVLARVDGVPVLCRQGNIIVSSFHPELSDDTRIHQLLVDAVGDEHPSREVS
jgi:5'-phosphate synthase pdxT subunit